MKESKILKVLEKVPSGTKLYSTAFGNLEFKSIIEAFGNKRIELMEDNRDRRVYFPDGRYRKGGEVTLYPSREMRDWDKFAWKKGDVLVNKDRDAHIVFEKFTDDKYTTFTGRHYYMNDGKNKDAARVCCNVSTKCYTLETAEKKVIEDIKPEHKFKPFEKVLVRDFKSNEWLPNLFGYKDLTSNNEHKYICVSCAWRYCIPYKGNEHLLGTSKNLEEE